MRQRAAGAPKIAVAGGLQIHLNIKRAFDSADRQQIIPQLFALPIPTAISHLIAAWHDGASYVLEHRGLRAEIEAAKGARQGCKAAPFLWCVLTRKILLHLTQRFTYASVQERITLYADDMVITLSFHTRDELHACLRQVGVVIHTLEQHGLSISHPKPFALVSVGGARSHKISQSILKRAPQRTFLRVPTGATEEILIPITDRVKYIGVIVSFKNPEEPTLAHRLDLAKLASRRLSRWLWSRRPSLCAALRTNGIATPKLIQQLQAACVGMFRKMLGDHSFCARLSHRDGLDAIRAFWPLPLFEKAVLRLQSNLQNRLQHVDQYDITHQIPWRHLDSLIANLHDAQLTGPLPIDDLRIQDGMQNSAEFHMCPACDFCARSLPVLHGHMYAEHQIRHGRARAIRMPDAQPWPATVCALPYHIHNVALIQDPY